MTRIGDPIIPGRRGVLVAEIAVLVAVGLADLVLEVLIQRGAVPRLLTPLVPVAGKHRRCWPSRVAGYPTGFACWASPSRRCP
jgi:hypothetical protein